MPGAGVKRAAKPQEVGGGGVDNSGDYGTGAPEGRASEDATRAPEEVSWCPPGMVSAHP